MDIGAKISSLRKGKGLTLAELGQMVGVGASTVRKWETGFIENMRSDKIEKLATALDTTPADIMGWEEVDSGETAIPKPKLRSVARLEEADLSQEEDDDIRKFIDLLLLRRSMNER